MIPVLFELCFVVALLYMLSSAEEKFDDLTRGKTILEALHKGESMTANTILMLILDTDTDSKSKLDQLTNLDEWFSNPETAGMPDAYDYPELKSLAAQADSLKPIIKNEVNACKKILSDNSISEQEKRHRLNSSLRAHRNTLMQVVFEITPVDKGIERAESRLKTAEPEEMEKQKIAFGTFLWLTTFIALAYSLVLTKVFTEDLLWRLARISDNARLIASWKPLPPPEKGVDEIAEIDKLLHDASDFLQYARMKELAVLDHAASVICSLDQRLKFVNVNAATLHFWQFEPEEVIGQSLLNLVRNDTIYDTRLKFESAAESDGEIEIETIIRRKDRIFVNALWKVRWSQEKRLFFCVVHDVTALRAVERLKRHIISIVSHDLRAPLMSLGISFEIMSKRELSETANKEIVRCEKSLERIMQLVNDLIELEKIGAGKTNLEFGAVSAEGLFDEAKETLASLSEKQNLRISGPVGDAAVLGDEGKLIQVVTNLLSNAIKYSPQGATIKLSIEKQNGQVELQVQDEGPGIALEDQALVFDKFHQTKSNAPSLEMKSTGLGLAIVKMIVTAHNGTCGVRSTIGSGSTFWIRLPEFVDAEEEDPV